MAGSAARATIDVDELARSLYAGIGQSMRRIKQISNTGELSLSERAILARLERTGPTTAADLARAEHVTAQAMGATVTGLEARGLIERRPDPADRRRMILSVSAAARDGLRYVRDARARRLADVLRESFSADELSMLVQAAPLIERLGEDL